VTEPLIDPQHWRNCASMARIKAERVEDDRFKCIMLAIADLYDGLAERVEQAFAESAPIKPERGFLGIMI
jgi:hypothetical protein